MSEVAPPSNGSETSPYVELERAAWAQLAGTAETTLTRDEVARLRGLGDQLDLREIEQVYLPLSRLLNLHVAASQSLYRVTDTFLGSATAKVPFVIQIGDLVEGLCGSETLQNLQFRDTFAAIRAFLPASQATLGRGGVHGPPPRRHRRGPADRSGLAGPDPTVPG